MSPSSSHGGSASGSGIGAILFSSALGGPAANIDTGAGGIAGTQTDLEIQCVLRTDDAGASVFVTFIVNNDTGANYDWQRVEGSNVTAAAAVGVAQTAWSIRVHGNGGTASYPGVVSIFIPRYAATTLAKSGTILSSCPDGTAGNNAADAYSVGWRSTAAITRLRVAATANLLAGSSVAVYGK